MGFDGASVLCAIFLSMVVMDILKMQRIHRSTHFTRKPNSFPFYDKQ